VTDAVMARTGHWFKKPLTRRQEHAVALFVISLSRWLLGAILAAVHKGSLKRQLEGGKVMSKPVMELHCGFVRLTVWSNEKVSERQGYPVLNFTVERRCKTNNGDWHSSPSFFLRDLTDLETLCAWPMKS